MKKIKGHSSHGFKNVAGMSVPKLRTTTIYGNPAMKPVNKLTADVMKILNKDREDLSSNQKDRQKTKSKKIKSKNPSIGDLKAKTLVQKQYVCAKCGATMKVEQVANHKRCGTGFKGITIPTNSQKEVKTNKPVNIQDKFNQLREKFKKPYLDKSKKRRPRLLPPPVILPPR